MSVLNIGVIGTGMGRLHMERFAAVGDDVRIAGVCDLNLEEAKHFAALYDAKIVTDDCQQFVADDRLDAISIAVPNRLHAPFSIAALEAGKHVLCEKPMAITVEDAEKMVAAAERAGKRLMINQSQRFDEGTHVIRSYADRGEFGKVYFAIATWIRRKGWPVLNMGPGGIMGRGEWFIRKEDAGGGALMDIGVHLLDLAWYLMGSPAPVAVTGASFLEVARGKLAERKLPAEVDELTAAQIRFKNGASLQLVVSWDSHNAPDHSVRLLGSDAGASVFPPVIYRGGDVIETAQLAVPEGGLAIETAYQHFVACVRDPGRKMIASGEEMVAIVRMLVAIQECAETGREVLLQ